MIALTGLTNETRPQLDLFDNHRNMVKLNEPLMKTFDKINDRYGRGAIKLACGLTGKKPADGETDPRLLKRDYLSPCYTTNIKEIPLIY